SPCSWMVRPSSARSVKLLPEPWRQPRMLLPVEVPDCGRFDGGTDFALLSVSGFAVPAVLPVAADWSVPVVLGLVAVLLLCVEVVDCALLLVSGAAGWPAVLA